MSDDDALEQFALAADAFADGDYEAAADGFAQVWAYQRERGNLVLEGEAGVATPEMVLINLASACQRSPNWERMYEATSALVALDDARLHRMLHAIALKHRGQGDEALALIRAVVADHPEYGSGHYELATQLLSRGRKEEALDALAAALEAGASADAIAVDPELSALEDHPRFVELISDAHTVRMLGRRIAARHEDLVPGELDDAYVEQMETILPLVSEMLLRMDLQRDASSGQVRARRLSPDQRAALEGLVACPLLWHAIPFLNLLGDAGLPSLSAADTRAWLDAR